MTARLGGMHRFPKYGFFPLAVATASFLESGENNSSSLLLMLCRAPALANPALLGNTWAASSKKRLRGLNEAAANCNMQRGPCT